VGDYLYSKGSNENMLDIGSSIQLEVSTSRGEIEGMGTLETSEAPVENIPLPIARMETRS